MKRVFFAAVAVSSVIYTCLTAWSFAKFVSDFSAEHYDVVVDIWKNVSVGHKGRDYRAATKEDAVLTSTVWTLSWDVLLVVLFMFVHTVLASRGVKHIFHINDLQVIERSLYNAASCVSLKVLISYWSTVYYYPLWIADVKTSAVWWWMFYIIQSLAWFIVYTGCVMMDSAELLGVRQIYYYLRGFSEPMSYKSLELQRLYSHMRHPSFVGFCVAFWIFPYMTLDRGILALMLTVYMIAAFRADKNDYVYQREQRIRKVCEVTHSLSYSHTY